MYKLIMSLLDSAVQGVASSLPRLGELFSLMVHDEVLGGSGGEGISYLHLKR